MPERIELPEFASFSSTNRVNILLADWRAELAPDRTAEELERLVYGRAIAEYRGGDYGFGLWCWLECDRLANAFGGKVGEVGRVVGEGNYLGFTHRRAIALKVPLERLYRPRKGDMSTPRPEAIVLPSYQLLCLYAARAADGDARSKALLEIALGEAEERRRADPYAAHFETFRKLLERSTAARGTARAATGP